VGQCRTVHGRAGGREGRKCGGGKEGLPPVIMVTMTALNSERHPPEEKSLVQAP